MSWNGYGWDNTTAYSNNNQPYSQEPSLYGSHGGGYSQQQQSPPPSQPYYGQQHAHAYAHAHAHGTQLQSPPQYYVPPAPHDVAVDPNQCRRWYSSQLQQLTFNSKPIITQLTLFAHEHAIRMSSVIAQSIEDHIKQCPPEFKLPAFYLLDSISKNIGPPYILLFARFIERLFLTAYHVVDPPTKIKFEELLGTWRTGAADGGELFKFPEEGQHGRVQRGIETTLFGAHGRGGGLGAQGRPVSESQSYQSGVQQTPAMATPGERSGVLFDIRRLLATRQEQAMSMQEDEVTHNQINALQKLESLVLNTQLTSDQVQRIRGQIAALAPPPAMARDRSATPLGASGDSHLRPTPAVAPSSSSLISAVKTEPPIPGFSSSTPEPGFAPVPSTSSAPVPHPSILSGQNLERAVRSLLSPGPPEAPSSSASDAAPGGGVVGGIDLSLLASLQASGGLSSLLASTAAAQQSSHEQGSSTAASRTTIEADDHLVQEYNHALMELDVNLTNQDISSYRPDAPSFIYGRLPLQCKQCGLRFFDSRRGKQMMDVHLDWHFTHKRRIREGAGRTQGRSWAALEEDWIHADDLDALDGLNQASTSSATAAGSSAAAASTSALLDRAVLKKRHVPAPTDPTALARPCPICKEKFKAEWSEQDEEWVFWNAVDVEGVIYHATCHAEAAASASVSSSSSRVANKLLKQEQASSAATGAESSRENTPVPVLRERDNGLGGLESSAKKRKAVDDGEGAGAGAGDDDRKPVLDGLQTGGDGGSEVAANEAGQVDGGRALKRPKSEPE